MPGWRNCWRLQAKIAPPHLMRWPRRAGAAAAGFKDASAAREGAGADAARGVGSLTADLELDPFCTLFSCCCLPMRALIVFRIKK